MTILHYKMDIFVVEEGFVKLSYTWMVDRQKYVQLLLQEGKICFNMLPRKRFNRKLFLWFANLVREPGSAKVSLAKNFFKCV